MAQTGQATVTGLGGLIRGYISGVRRDIEDKLDDGHLDKAAAYVLLDQRIREGVRIIQGYLGEGRDEGRS